MRISLVVFLFAFTACQQQTPPVAEAIDSVQIEAELTDVLNQIIAAAEAADNIDDLTMHWLDDYYGASNGMAMNKAKMVERMGPAFEMTQSQDFRMDVRHIEVLSSDAAAMSVQGVFTATSNEGVTGPERPISWTFVFVKKDGAWKIMQSHQSFPPVG